MKEYWYDTETRYLHTDEEMNKPFLCSTECTPLKFDNVSSCLKFLKEQNFEGSVSYKLNQNEN